MKRNQLKLEEFISPDLLEEQFDMSAPNSALASYVQSMYETISKMNTLAFQLASYNNPDKEQFQANNSTPLIEGLKSLRDYFAQLRQEKFRTLAEHNLTEFRRALMTGTTFVPKYSWNPSEDVKLSQQHSASSVDVTPVQASPYRLPERIPGGNPGTVRKLPDIQTPLTHRIALDRK